LLLFGAVLVCDLEARRIRVRPQEDQDDTEYYESEPQDSQDQRVVYISAADQYNGLYGQPSASSRSSQPNYIQSDARSGPSIPRTRTKDPAKSPPVQTIRNYNKVNDDGSFTFGYEAADGSFKEETRGTDCVVRGKYGYVDPDGNKREFTYVSGNPCDPNAPKEEDQEQDDRIREGESGESDNIPNYPTRPIRPLRPIAPAERPKSPITLFQNNYVRDEEDDVESEAVLKPQPIQPARSRPPVYIPRPTQYVLPQTTTEAPAAYRSSQIFSPIPSSTPSSVIYKNTITPLSITPRPALRFDPVTTYRPQTLQFAATPKPSLLYTKPIASYTPKPIDSYTPRPIATYTQKTPIFTYTTPTSVAPSPARTNIDFDAEFQKFQQENNVVQPTPATSLPKAVTSKPFAKIPITPAPSSATSGPVYSSALLYDPSSGQYNTQLYQTLPQTNGDFTLKHKIQPYVHQPQPQVVNFQQLAQQSPLYKAQAPVRPSNNQALYQQQQSELQFQNSAQLYTQQQKARQQQQQ
ncbi:Insect cuticle protein, partial [Oryctes borbonicus]